MEQSLYLSVLTLRTKPGQRQALLDLYVELDILRRALAQPGAREMTITAALEDSEGILITSCWDDPASYQAWLDHPERGEMTDKIGPFLDGEPVAATYQVLDRVGAAG
jgi:quinol monooxygenase YgiN